MIDAFLTAFPESETCWDTLKNCSADTSRRPPVYLTQSPYSVLNGDKMKTAYTQRLHCSDECLASVDAFFEKDGTLFWVEFKNERVSEKNAFRIKRKASDSLLLFLDVSGLRRQAVHDQSEFILVYGENNTAAPSKSTDSGLDAITHSVMQLAQTELVRFGLDKLTGVHFRKVRTLTPTEFDDFCRSHGIPIR